MRPTFTEMLAGIESVQATVVMPRILACGEMDVLWETGFSFRLLGFLRENGGRLLDLVILENRQILGLLQRAAPEIETAGASLRDPALAARFGAWADGATRGFEDQGGGAGAARVPFLERIYLENGRLKSALNELVLMLEEAAKEEPAAGSGGAPAADRVRAALRDVIRENVARQSALSEELLRLWRG